MLRPVTVRDEPRVGALVEAALREADRERVHGLRGLLGRERRERGRVDAAGEEDADRYVREQMRPHGVAQPSPQLLDQLGLVAVPQLAFGGRARTRITL